jgi:hypothetical protein
VKDQRSSIAARIADTITGGVRRRQKEREPRAIVFDASGEPRIVAAGSDEQVALIEAAEELIALTGASGPATPPS